MLRYSPKDTKERCYLHDDSACLDWLRSGDDLMDSNNICANRED